MYEIVRPILPRYWSHNGLWMEQSVEYTVYRIFPPGPRASIGETMVEDGYKIGYGLVWGTPVLERLEAPPSLEQLNAVCDKLSNYNRELLQGLFKEAAAQGIKIGSPKVFRTRAKERSYFLNMDKSARVGDLNKQASTCIKIMINGGKASDGYSEEELIQLLRQHGPMLNTRQDPWKVFNFYKKNFLEMGLLVVEEPEKTA